MFQKVILLFVFVCLSFTCYAQNDDLMKQDSVTTDTSVVGKAIITRDTLPIATDRPVQQITSVAKKWNPRRASLLAAVLPGAGQIYNRKYWKAPLVWTGFGLLAWGITFTQHQHTFYRNELFDVLNKPGYVPPDGATLDQLRTIVNSARRQRDYFLIINFFWYILQIVDAHVDAHLKEFDLNPNLQVRVETLPVQNTLMGSTGLTLAFKF